MIIALDATSLTGSTGGVPRYTLALALALAENFPDDQYWLLSDQAFTVPSGLPPNLRAGDRPTGFQARRWWMWGLPRTLARLGVEVFHGTDFSVPYSFRRPSVMTLHDLSPWLDPHWQPAAGRVRRRTPLLLRSGLCTMVITPTEAIRRQAIERFGLAPDRVIAIPLAAESRFHPVRATPPVVPYFLFVGTLEPRKNIPRLVEAWREVRKSHNVDLVLAGRTRSDFVTPAVEPGLRVLGPVPDSELPALYSGALACVYPSLYEGFGLPVLEAMQCGALVITSKDPAIREVAGEAAVHVDLAGTGALADALKAAVSQPDRFLDLRQKAVARAGEFSWTKTAQRTREVYDRAIRAFRQ